MVLAGSYLDRDEFAARCGEAIRRVVLGSWIDPSGSFTDPEKVARRDAWFTFVDSTLVECCDDINARLRKRYLAPFSSPVPATIFRWLKALALPLIYEGRGWDPAEPHAVSVLDRESRANDEIKEAADAEKGLYDLPLRQGSTESALSPSVGGPLSYSEASPFTWIDTQRAAVAQEVAR